MKTCSVCHKKITPRMLRHGAALSRGGVFLHRDCRGAAQAPPLAPRATPAPRPQAAPRPPITLTPEYASFGRRFLAQLIDSVILNVAVLAAAIPLGMASALHGGSPGPGSTVATVLGIVLPVVYFVGYWTRGGATPGKKALGIRVVNAQDRRPTGTQSVVRYLGYILSALPLGLGYAWMLWDPEKRCWHDMLSGTRVVRV